MDFEKPIPLTTEMKALFASLPGEVKTRLEPTLGRGTMGDFLETLKSLRGQLDVMITNLEKARAASLGHSSGDSGKGGIEGNTGEKPAAVGGDESG